MVLFTILLLVLVLVAAIILTLTGVVGTGVVLLFGDAIAFGLIIWLIVKICKKKK